MNISFLYRTAALIAVLAAPLATPAQSSSGDGDVAPAISVKYGDLDLSKAAGIDVLYQRIRNAAKATCVQFDTTDLVRRHRFDACVDHAVAGAVIQTKLPLLADLYTKKTGVKLTPNIMTAQR